MKSINSERGYQPVSPQVLPIHQSFELTSPDSPNRGIPGVWFAGELAEACVLPWR
jgi:hypothetical protein